MPIRSLVMVPNVRTSLCPGVITHATTDFLCTSSPAHLSCTISIATTSINGGLVGDGCRLDQDIPLRAHTRVRPHYVVPVSNQPQVISRALGTKGSSRVFPDQTRAFHSTWRGGRRPPYGGLSCYADRRRLVPLRCQLVHEIEGRHLN